MIKIGYMPEIIAQLYPNNEPLLLVTLRNNLQGSDTGNKCKRNGFK
jgi:hypothetical protein